MPICTSCTVKQPYLYTVYDSSYNLRLQLCEACNTFADPYVEHDAFSLLLDLILLKRQVYRHLLFNRGAKPRRVSQRADPEIPDETQELARINQERWKTIFRLGSILILVDAFIRWSALYPINDQEQSDAFSAFLRVAIGCLLETVAFHMGVIVTSFLMAHIASRLRPSSRRIHTTPSQISLSLFYSSIAKLFLLLLLSIWRIDEVPSSEVPSLWWPLSFLAEESIDREWIIRNVLGGMAAGFGLRVILDAHPVVMMMIILMGWGIKTMLASVIGPWVGQCSRCGDHSTILAYSIP